MAHYHEYLIDGRHRVQAEQVHPSKNRDLLMEFCPSLRYAGSAVNGIRFPQGDEPYDAPPREEHPDIPFFSVIGRYGHPITGHLYDWIVHDEGEYLIVRDSEFATHYREVKPV